MTNINIIPGFETNFTVEVCAYDQNTNQGTVLKTVMFQPDGGMWLDDKYFGKFVPVSIEDVDIFDLMSEVAVHTVDSTLPEDQDYGIAIRRSGGNSQMGDLHQIVESLTTEHELHPELNL